MLHFFYSNSYLRYLFWSSLKHQPTSTTLFLSTCDRVFQNLQRFSNINYFLYFFTAIAYPGVRSPTREHMNEWSVSLITSNKVPDLIPDIYNFNIFLSALELEWGSPIYDNWVLLGWEIICLDKKVDINTLEC